MRSLSLFLGMGKQTSPETKGDEMFTVKHSWPNPANNRTLKFDDLEEATAEMLLMSSDEPGSCSYLINGDKVIATRDWVEKEITWF